MGRISGRHGRKDRTPLKRLVEAIVLQAVEDLWSSVHWRESVEFFSGPLFKDCADIIGMDLHERRRLLTLAERALRSNRSIMKICATDFRMKIPAPYHFRHLHQS